jgi:hypothetical protein
VGCTPQLKKLTKKLGYQQNVFLWLSERFKSPVVGLRLGGQLVVAVSGYHAVKQIFTREEFEGRPDTFFIRMRSMGTRKGDTCSPQKSRHKSYIIYIFFFNIQESLAPMVNTGTSREILPCATFGAWALAKVQWRT